MLASLSRKLCADSLGKMFASPSFLPAACISLRVGWFSEYSATGTARRPGVHSVCSMLMTAQASQQQRSRRHAPLPSVFDSAPGSFCVLLFSGTLALLKKNTYPPNRKVAPTTPYKGKRLPALRDCCAQFCVVSDQEKHEAVKG